MKAKGRNVKCSHKGEDSPSAKLTEEDVLAIRADLRPRREIAAEYGIHPKYVRRLQMKKTWKHI